MESIQIDWLVVFIAAVLNMIIGFFWYSKWLFGPAWMKLSAFPKKEITGNYKCFLHGFIVSLIIAFFLSFFEGALGVTTVTDGMFVGFCFWIGFVATTQIASVIWEKKSWKLFFLHTGNKLLSYLVMSGLIGA